MKKVKVDTNPYGDVFRIKQKTLNGMKYRLCESTNYCGQTFYHIETICDGMYSAVGKLYFNLETSLLAFDNVELFF